jgi:hypothetical protein
MTAALVTAVEVPSAFGQVVINEVLYDPDGPDAGLEFVELLNCSEQGVQLSGWVVETGNGAGPDDWTVEWVGGALDYLAPGEIFLIGEADVEPGPDYVTSLDLQNGPDGVRLSDGNSVVDVVGWGEPLFQEYYEGAPAPDVVSGLSLGRAPDCFDSGDNALDLIGSAPTPGTRNALGYDLSVAVPASSRRVFEAGADAVVDCVILNVGSLEVTAGSGTIGLFPEGQAAAVSEIPVDLALGPRDSTSLSLAWPHPPSGYYRAEVRLAFPADQDFSDNAARTSFRVGDAVNLLVINEVMHSPTDEQTEWVELVSVARGSVNVAGWGLGDGVERHDVSPDGTLSIPPGGYLLLVRDIEDVEWPDTCPVRTTDGWEALSSEDVVCLTDEYGTPVDVVSYDRKWGGERGVSLERVRADMPSQDARNWGGCVSPDGSTPGRANSISLSAAPSPGLLTLSPNPFTPNGDGRDDRCVVRFELPVPRSTVRITVFDVVGRERGVLMDHEAVASRGELLWDGSDADGNTLPSGLYIISLEAIDARAGVLATARTAVGIVR